MTAKQVSSAFLKKSPTRAAAQKTFANLGQWTFRHRGLKDQKFFASFFQKRGACLP
jgi:hypothetical protein